MTISDTAKGLASLLNVSGLTLFTNYAVIKASGHSFKDMTMLSLLSIIPFQEDSIEYLTEIIESKNELAEIESVYRTLGINYKNLLIQYRSAIIHTFHDNDIQHDEIAEEDKVDLSQFVAFTASKS